MCALTTTQGLEYYYFISIYGYRTDNTFITLCYCVVNILICDMQVRYGPIYHFAVGIILVSNTKPTWY